jgi:hypothetical protein
MFFMPMTQGIGAEVRSEFIFEQAPFESCHASTMVETAGGEFLAAWFGGAGEGEADVAIWMSRLSHNRWSAPAPVAREKGVPTWNPVLFRGRQIPEASSYWEVEKTIRTGPRVEVLGARPSPRGSDAPVGLEAFLFDREPVVQSIFFMAGIRKFSTYRSDGIFTGWQSLLG